MLVLPSKDGMVKHAKGAHAYTLGTKNDDEHKCVTGTAMTPSDLSSLTSLRTEHYGALGVAVIMYCLAKIHRVKRSEAITIYHHIDNITVRDRLNKKIMERSLGGTDYDVWSQTTQLLRILPITITYCHVKGHQADTLYKQCGTTGPLD